MVKITKKVKVFVCLSPPRVTNANGSIVPEITEKGWNQLKMEVLPPFMADYLST